VKRSINLLEQYTNAFAKEAAKSLTLNHLLHFDETTVLFFFVSHSSNILLELTLKMRSTKMPPSWMPTGRPVIMFAGQMYVYIYIYTVTELLVLFIKHLFPNLGRLFLRYGAVKRSSRNNIVTVTVLMNENGTSLQETADFVGDHCKGIVEKYLSAKKTTFTFSWKRCGKVH
jgi:hypothetical protein